MQLEVMRKNRRRAKVRACCTKVVRLYFWAICSQTCATRYSARDIVFSVIVEQMHLARKKLESFRITVKRFLQTTELLPNTSINALLERVLIP